MSRHFGHAVDAGAGGDVGDAHVAALGILDERVDAVFELEIPDLMPAVEACDGVCVAVEDVRFRER